MRRRTAPPADDDRLGAPVELHRCYVEDWVDPDYDVRGPEDSDVASWAMLIARSRFNRARDLWEHDHDLEHGDLGRAYGHNRPWFRDRAAFVAAVTRR